MRKRRRFFRDPNASPPAVPPPTLPAVPPVKRDRKCAGKGISRFRFFGSSAPKRSVAAEVPIPDEAPVPEEVPCVEGLPVFFGFSAVDEVPVSLVPVASCAEPEAVPVASALVPVASLLPVAVEVPAKTPIKHEVVRSKDLVGNQRSLNAFRSWVSSSRSCPCAFLCGPPGVGKTSGAHLVLREAGYNVREWNASEVRKPKELAQALRTAISVPLAGRRSAVVLDEIDGIDGGEEAFQPMMEFLKGHCAGTSVAPIVLIANSRLGRELRVFAGSKWCVQFTFRRLFENDLRKVLVRHLQKQGACLPLERQRTLVAACEGDARSLLLSADWQALVTDTAACSTADHRRTCFEFMERLAERRLARLSLNEQERMQGASECDLRLAPNMLFENYPESFTDMHGASEMAELLSIGDVLARDSFGRERMAVAMTMGTLHLHATAAPQRCKFPRSDLFRRPRRTRDEPEDVQSALCHEYGFVNE